MKMENYVDVLTSYVKNRTVYKKYKMSMADHTIPYGYRYGGRVLKNNIEIVEKIQDYIQDGKPFFMGRFGSTELFTTSVFAFKANSKKAGAMNQLKKWSGFFPEDVELGEKFANQMLKSMVQLDVLGVWFTQFEDYYIKHYISDNADITYLSDIEPWVNPLNPWSKSLAGKKVLVIHPFADTIQKQYSNHRKDIFPGTEILPEFKLMTLKAVQTSAEETDERFNTWFEALEWMYVEAMKKDFDVAILGCGAYGFPLAAKLKEAGKQAIHLGGVTQILFGIKGKRWDTEKHYEYIRKLYNDAWVYPSDDEIPKGAKKIENGCYWK